MCARPRMSVSAPPYAMRAHTHASNDGMVTVAETRWPGARDHIVLPVTHMQMLWSSACLRQTLHFLDHGFFERPAAAPGASFR